MWDKLKSFFNGVTFTIIVWCVWILSTVILVLQGFSKVDIGKALDYVVIVIQALGVLIVFIKCRDYKKQIRHCMDAVAGGAGRN